MLSDLPPRRRVSAEANERILGDVTQGEVRLERNKVDAELVDGGWQALRKKTTTLQGSKGNSEEGSCRRCQAASVALRQDVIIIM